jgi:peptidoglycan hydrolase-like protein with peptidoglycan-binding domain
MWIWYVDRSDRGDSAAIAARASASGVRTLFVKSGDGTSYWSQFSGRLVRSLHARGVHVCAWQYVYGTHPVGEAAIGARAVRVGADCLVIDAEAEYEGRYASAQSYVDALRAMVGRRYPVGLASFPYVDDHPAFPYSVFLGHNGATFNLPQMYWQDIGTSVDAVYGHTYMVNGIYRRPIRPLGQTDSGASAVAVRTFRGVAVSFGAPAVSWWDYAWTSADGLWPAVGGPFLGASVARPGVPVLHTGSKGDMVLWMQELLASVIPSEATDGIFGAHTRANLKRFQRRHGIPATGQTGPRTWRALLRLRAVRVHWAAASLAPHAARAVNSARAPRSARLPAHAYEIHRPAGTDGAR